MTRDAALALKPSEIVGVIGDVHAEDEHLADALSRLDRFGATTILCTGDIADGPGSVERCCQLLQARGVVTIRGNHDRWLLGDTMRALPFATRRGDLNRETLDYVAQLPETARFASPFGGVLLCHGLGNEDMASVSADDFGYALENNLELHALIADASVRVVINGHTHRPLVRHFSGLTVVNAGTLFREHEPGYVVVDFGTSEVRWHELAGDSARTLVLGRLVE